MMRHVIVRSSNDISTLWISGRCFRSLCSFQCSYADTIDLVHVQFECKINNQWNAYCSCTRPILELKWSRKNNEFGSSCGFFCSMSFFRRTKCVIKLRSMLSIQLERCTRAYTPVHLIVLFHPLLSCAEVEIFAVDFVMCMFCDLFRVSTFICSCAHFCFAVVVAADFDDDE